jgi:hypothetical protein
LKVTRHFALLHAIMVLGWLMVAPVPALAHAGTGPHGGPVTDAGPYYVELILKDGQLRLFAFDDKSDAPVDAKSAHGTATILIGDKKETVELAPVSGPDGNLLGGSLADAGPGTRIVVILRFPGQPSMIARFAI